MRIIGGRFKGRRLVAPDGAMVRPTADRAREAVFNRLEHRFRSCEGARVIDLFAGSGALGFEALSRGAVSVLFVEQNVAARAAIRENAEALGVMADIRVFKRDATRLGPRPAAFPLPFDLVFCDPPYGKGLGPLALASARDGDWLAADALVVFERGADEALDDLTGFACEDEHAYGAAKIAILTMR